MTKYDEELLYTLKRINETLDRLLYLAEKKEIKDRNTILKSKTKYVPTIEGEQ